MRMMLRIIIVSSTLWTTSTMTSFWCIASMAVWWVSRRATTLWTLSRVVLVGRLVGHCAICKGFRGLPATFRVPNICGWLQAGSWRCRWCCSSCCWNTRWNWPPCSLRRSRGGIRWWSTGILTWKRRCCQGLVADVLFHLKIFKILREWLRYLPLLSEIIRHFFVPKVGC